MKLRIVLSREDGFEPDPDQCNCGAYLTVAGCPNPECAMYHRPRLRALDYDRQAHEYRMRGLYFPPPKPRGVAHEPMTEDERRHDT